MTYIHCVCRWNEIIGQSTAIMKALPLSLSGSWLRLYQNVKNLKRKYHTIKIDSSETWNQNAYKVLSKHGKEMRRLELSGCFIEEDDFELWTRTFDTFTRLESIVLRDIETSWFSTDSPIQPANLPHLKKVVMNDSDVFVSRNQITSNLRLSQHISLQMLSLMKSAKLKSLKINGELDEFEREEFFLDFLIAQPQLEELAIRSLDFAGDT